MIDFAAIVFHKCTETIQNQICNNHQIKTDFSDREYTVIVIVKRLVATSGMLS